MHDGFAKGQTVLAHHPIDRCAARAALAQAVPKALPWRDDERGLVVVMKWTEAEEVFAVRPELDPGASDEGGEIRLPLHPLELVLRESRHSASRRNRVKRVYTGFELRYCLVAPSG
jgi:hypothetical protein